MAEIRQGPPSQRIDKFLWYARIVKSRGQAQVLVERGVIRLNGRRIERAHVPVRIGDLITTPHGPHVRVLRVLRILERRGPPAEAATAVEELEPGSGFAS